MSVENTSPSQESVNPVHEQQRRLVEEMRATDLPQVNEKPGPSACLRPLLTAVGWRGEARHLFEALPHFDEIETVDDLRAVLARLNYNTLPKKLGLHELNEDFLPCLFTRSDGDVLVILKRTDEGVHVFDAQALEYRVIDADRHPGQAYLLAEIDIQDDQKQVLERGWMSVLVYRFRRLFVTLLTMTFVINLFALSIPLFVMNVYDKVIGTRAQDVLGYFLAGILIVILADLALRAIRGRALAYLGSRCSALLSAAAFQQILHLPIAMTERAPVGSQLARIKQFEGIREIFSGTIASALLDLPFMLVFLGVIIVIGGAVAWVPVALIVMFGIMAVITIPLTRRCITACGEAGANMQNFLIETATKHRTIREANAVHIWLDRYRVLSSNLVTLQARAQLLGNVVQTLAQSLVMISGVATLAIGTLMVMAEQMTMGALIAVMALVWRVLSPIQALFLSLNRFSQVVRSFSQINQLMRLQPERQPGQLPSFYRKFKGDLGLARVSFRYTQKSEPALLGLTLEIPAGQVVAVTGSSGSGKSTLLKVIAGLYTPQAGAVNIDGLDLRQLNVGELRNAVGYVPQHATFFYGTVDQNIRLAHPSASDRDIAIAGGAAGMKQFAQTLPEGRETRLDSSFQRRMPDGLKQRLILARAYVKNAAIYLLDEPANNLDSAGDQALMKKINALRGKSTVVMVTHRPSHMRIADRVVYMERGIIVHDGKPEQVLPLILNAA